MTNLAGVTKPPYDGRRPAVLAAVFTASLAVQLGGLSLGWWPVTILAAIVAAALVRGPEGLLAVLLSTCLAWSGGLWLASGGRVRDVADVVAALVAGAPASGWAIIAATFAYALACALAGSWLGTATRRMWGPRGVEVDAAALAKLPRVRVFNRVAESYDARFGEECARMHDVALDWVDAGGAEPEVVLDVGCGTGRFLAAAAKRWPGARLIGVDPAQAMLDQARAAVPAAQLCLGVAERLALPSDSVDVVVSTTSFGQWTDQLAGLREIRRVLRAGGRCYLIEHGPAAPLVRLLLRVPDFRGPEQTRRLLDQAGLRVDRVELVYDNVIAAAATARSDGG